MPTLNPVRPGPHLRLKWQGRILVCVMLGVLLGVHQDLRAAANRTEQYEQALSLAKASGKDIVVFQRGSDWNRLGETLYQDVWLKDEFARELGDGFMLVAVDRPETATEPSALRLANLSDAKTPLPANEVTAVESAAKVAFAARPDGAFLAKASPNPDKDTLSLQLKVKGGGRVLRLDFPPDSSLPGTGPGRAPNGNFCVSEIVVRNPGKQIAITAAWANSGRPEQGAWRAIDGIADQPDNFWNALTNGSHRSTLFLLLKDALQPGETLSIQLQCLSGSKQHVPGCVRVASLHDAATEADVRACAEHERKAALNAKYTWWDTSVCPRIALLDSQGRAVASENKPRLGLTPKTMAARVKELRAIREKRDALWAKAEAVQGPARAEWLRQGLDVMAIANWSGNDKCYVPIHDKIRAADPKDESGALRWLTFGGDPRDGLKWAEPGWSKALANKDLSDKNFMEALARIDKELKDPRNKALDHERIQRMMIAKYLVYSRWPKHQEQRFDIQREIAALDPDTFWGIGAIGDLAMNHQTATPMLTYGWGGKQVKPGINRWNMADTAYFFDHAGPYKVFMLHKSGKDELNIKRIALMDGASVLAEATPSARLGPEHPSVAVDLELETWSEARKLVLIVEAETTGGQTNSSGVFVVEPQLPPAPKRVVRPALDDVGSQMLARGEIDALQRKLGDALMAEAAKGDAGISRIVSSPELQANLLRCTLIRLCGIGYVENIASRDGGAMFLQSLFNDANWLESFLASDKAVWPANWPTALENLYILHRYGTGWEQPINQRIGTALALQWGHYDRDWSYLLVERFGLIKQALRDGLMHSSFEKLNVREMRWAVMTQGKRRDFQFLLDDRQTRIRDYLGAHGAVRYVSNNVYGVSVHEGGKYHAPWWHAYGTFSLPVHRRVGGVCGACSGYGSVQAVVHGVPSSTIGQPGHCAYVVRVGQEWPVGNSVTWPSDITIRGWDGTNHGTLNRLYEPMSQDRDHLMAATRLAWLAQLQADRATAQVRILPGLKYSLYQQGGGAGFPDFTKLKADQSGPCHTFEIAAITPFPAKGFAAVWEGQLEVTGTGPLVFSATSSGNSQVLVDGRKVVGSSGRQLRKAEIILAPGRHPLRVEYCQSGGYTQLNVGFEGVVPAAATDWIRTYEQAILAQPLNYLTWIDYIKLLETVKDAAPAKWLDLGQRAARTFSAFNEAGWALTRRCLDKAFPTMKPVARMEVLLACNRELRQENWYKPESFPYEGIFDWQNKSLGDPELGVELFGKLLAIHHSDKPNCNFIFGNVMSWGSKRFAGNPATAPAYAKAMAAFFQAKGASLDRNLLVTTVKTSIRKASEAGDIASYHLWTDMAEKLLPPLKPDDVHLKPAQMAAYPKYQPFPGHLLSPDGMLQTSSANPDDRPLSYRQILSGGSIGWFDTASDKKPWAQVQLPGEGELSGIVLVGRHEYPPNHVAYKAAPLKVSVSLDGKTWTEVASFEKDEMVFRVDLQGKNLLARYVRAERVPGPQETKPFERFNLRGFMVYGRKLY